MRKKIIYKNYIIYENGKIFTNFLNKFMGFSTNEDGYKKVKLKVSDNKYKTFSVHKLVAESFIEKIDGKNFVNHIDGNKENNDASNLEWCTHSENIQHAWDNGLIKSTAERSYKISKANKGRRIGEQNKKSKKVKCINTGEKFESMNLASEKYNIKSGAISRACNGIRKHAGNHPITKEPLKWEFI